MGKILKNLDEIIAGVALALIVICVTVNVICRYIFGFIFNSAEELAVIAFIWCTYLGTAVAYRRDSHVGINVIVNLFPERIRKVLDLFVHILVFVLNCVIFYLSIFLAKSSITKSTPILGMSYTFVNLSLTLGFFLMMIYGVLKIIRTIQELKEMKGGKA